jgi:hypothetical protein
VYQLKILGMFRVFIAIFFISISISVSGQDNKIMDSVGKIIKTKYKKVKWIKNANDTALFITNYDKNTHALLGVIIFIRDTYHHPEFPAGQYHWYFLPDSTVLFKAFTSHSDGRHAGRARYLFQNGMLIAKDGNKYAEQDLSHIYPKAAQYKQAAREFLRQKFGN